jgi:hypothetical protein
MSADGKETIVAVASAPAGTRPEFARRHIVAAAMATGDST